MLDRALVFLDRGAPLQLGQVCWPSGLGGFSLGLATLAACHAELRSSARRIRTFVFVALAAAGILGTLAFASLETSRIAPLAGAYAPRFVLSAVGNVWLWLFLVATVFLAFDTRQQDERARVAEVLDAKPMSNLALLGGRLAGTVLVTWLALAAIAVLIQAGGTVSRMVYEASGDKGASLTWWLAVVVEPVSLLTLVAVDALPALAFATALVLFLTTALRRRTPTLLVGLTLIGLHAYAVARVPMYLQPAVSLVTSHADFASDVVPTYVDTARLVQRIALLSFAAALLAGAAALHPRDDGGSRRRRGLAAILFATVGGAGSAAVVADAVNDLAVREEWLAAQEEARDLRYPHLRSVRGEVWIEPGRNLATDLELRVAAPPNASLQRLHFSLNPGIEVHAAEIAGEPVDVTHFSGILTVEIPGTLAPGDELSLLLRANGVPDERFTYLDSAVDWRRLPAFNRLALLGTDGLVFSSSYVALVPGGAWLPTAGPNLADRSGNAFTVDLVVHVPETWLVAGPGRRQTVSPGIFRFNPANPVPDVGLFAARFERRAIEAGGVLLEFLVVPEHAGYLDDLGDVMGGEAGIAARTREMLDRAKERGLPYPYAGLSMVEVPARLRGYGGGWQMDSALFPPGLVLVPEYGFPTRFERVYKYPRMIFQVGPSLSSRAANYMQGALWRLFVREGAGGQPDLAARHVFAIRSSAEGTDAIALDRLCRVLAAWTVWRLYDTPALGNLLSSSPLFTAHRFVDESAVRANPFRSLVWGGGPSRIRAVDRPSVWEAAERTALTDLGALGNPALEMDVLTLRIDRAAVAIRDRYGLDKAAAVLFEIRRRFNGTGFDADALRQASTAAGVDLDATLGDWLNATGMPGFRASAVEAFRLKDDDEGNPRYQVLVNVRNSEPVPGLIRLTYVGSADGVPNARRQTSDPIPVAADSAVQIGRILAQPPEALWLRTYLSRNRADSYVPVADVAAAMTVEAEPFSGVRSSNWRPRDPGIVVDDLDAGFVVESTMDPIRLRGLVGPVETETDRGLPVYQGGLLATASDGLRDLQRGWTRQALPTAWGRYRRTVARAAAGQGSNKATFNAELPERGGWRLYYHMPKLGWVGFGSNVGSPDDEQGSYRLEITNAGTVITTDFDAAAATRGWNEVDVFDLEAGGVGVAVSDKTSGRSVVADAIRWELRDE